MQLLQQFEYISVRILLFALYKLNTLGAVKYHLHAK